MQSKTWDDKRAEIVTALSSESMYAFVGAAFY